MVVTIHPHLNWSVAGRTEQGTATTVPVSKLLLAKATVSGLVTADRLDTQMDQSLDGPSFNLLHFCPCSPLDRNFAGYISLGWHMCSLRVCRTFVQDLLAFIIFEEKCG